VLGRAVKDYCILIAFGVFPLFHSFYFSNVMHIPYSLDYPDSAKTFNVWQRSGIMEPDVIR
jgi:hypothetical protein